MSDLSGSVIQWRDLTIFGSRGLGRHTFSGLDGWDERKGDRDAARRAAGHGTMGSAPRSRGRTIVIRGSHFEPVDRDVIFAELAAAFALTDDVDAPAEDLTITHAGLTLSVPVWLKRWAPTTSAWGAGVFSWQAEFESDDWLRYGPPVARIASFPANLSGLLWPLFPGGVMDWGAASTSNLVTVSNSGNAAAPVQIEVSGPIDDAGFDAVDVATGRGLTFEAAVVAGSRVLLDGATGNVLLDGEFDRGDVLTSRYWPVIPKGGSLTLAFLRRGSDMGGAPSMTVTVRPAFW